MDKEELRKRMSKAIGTFENRMVYNISNDCAEIALKYFTEQLNKPLVGGPVSASALEGEQLGNEGSAKSVRVDECDHNIIESPHGYYCSKCNKLV